MLIKHNGRYYRNQTEITSEKYNEIMGLIRNRPTAPEGYAYRLTESLEWELYEQPVEEDEDVEEIVEEIEL